MTDPRLDEPPAWATAQSIARGIASTRAAALRLDDPTWITGKLERDEDWLITFAWASGLALGAVRHPVK